MISQRHRFHGRASIQRLYKNSKMVRSGTLSVHYTLNSRRNSYRVAVVVSRKVSKSAVIRNRIRRRIYEHVRIMFISNASGTPYDLMVTVFDARFATVPAQELGREVDKLLKKTKLIASVSSEHAIVEHRN
jgi:ribonuclease P protein component